jgi:L-xylulokinase
MWTQIFADTLQLPMEVPDGTEIGARGAAMSAGIGVGAYRDQVDAVDTAVKIERRQEPWDHLSRMKQGQQLRFRESLLRLSGFAGKQVSGFFSFGSASENFLA